VTDTEVLYSAILCPQFYDRAINIKIMNNDFNDRLNSQTRRRILQITGGLGAVTIGGVSGGAAANDTDIEFSGGGWGSTSTTGNALMTSVNMEVTFSNKVSFGPDKNRGFRITNVDTGATITVTTAEPFTVPTDERVEFSNLHNRDGTFVDEPNLINWVEDDTDIDAEVEGDTGVFSDGPVFSRYTIEVVENLGNPTPIASTDEAVRAIGLERPAIEQDGTSGNITLTLELPKALDSSWFVEFDSFIPDDGFNFEPTMVPNDGTDTLEWTVDFSESEQGNYDGWQLAIGPTEDVRSRNYIWSTAGSTSIDDDTITIGTDGGEEPTSDDEAPGFGVLSATAGLGGAGYLLKRRLSDGGPDDR
jgi:hypothetical protein